jgi:thiamine biosynthesis lipoprotein
MPADPVNTAVTLACQAMATRFEVVLQGDEPARLRGAGEEALQEVERLDAQLSLYNPMSEVAQLNRRAASGPVRVSAGLFRLLQQAQKLHEETGGAFDITIAPLMRAWGFLAGSGQLPDRSQLDEARACVGMHLVELDAAGSTVRFTRAGVMLDFGAIGKGYALERAATLLRESGITSALVHGGTSTVCAIGVQPNGEPWKIAVEQPPVTGVDAVPSPTPLAVIPLQDEALSVSAVWGKSFMADGKTYGHILDPRTGAPTRGASLAAVVLPSATETDALSTALLTVGLAGHDPIAALRPNMRTLLLAGGEGGARLEFKTRGIHAQLR